MNEDILDDEENQILEEEKDNTGNRVLSLAAAHGQLEMVRWLINKGASIYKKSIYKMVLVVVFQWTMEEFKYQFSLNTFHNGNNNRIHIYIARVYTKYLNTI